MERKETYATTGPRMIVRFFGGWDFDARRRADARCRPWSATARACRWAATCAPRRQARRRRSSSPRSRIRSARNLDRIQIVKGWLDAKGETHEKVYDVAWSGDRKPGADGKLPAVGNTVDVANATWTNTIGAPELITVWKDPDFDANAARVLLRARPRDPDAALDRVRREVLRHQDAARGADDRQERAYTSPIWYTP